MAKKVKVIEKSSNEMVEYKGVINVVKVKWKNWFFKQNQVCWLNDVIKLYIAGRFVSILDDGDEVLKYFYTWICSRRKK